MLLIIVAFGHSRFWGPAKIHVFICERTFCDAQQHPHRIEVRRFQYQRSSRKSPVAFICSTRWFTCTHHSFDSSFFSSSLLRLLCLLCINVSNPYADFRLCIAADKWKCPIGQRSRSVYTIFARYICMYFVTTETYWHRKPKHHKPHREATKRLSSLAFVGWVWVVDIEKLLP